MEVKTKLDNGIEIVQNFEWSMTKRKICIFMPSYHDKKYTDNSLRNIKTSVPKEDYIIIIGCDGNEQDYSGREDENVYFFHINRSNREVRNSAYVRNYCLKRCQSDLFFQKDGDVVVLGDFIKNCIEWSQPWRAGMIYVLDEEQTENYLDSNNPVFLDSPTKKIDLAFPEGVNKVKNIIYNAHGSVNMSTYFQYAFCAETKVMQDMNGYDEDYTYYGYEDSDMFCRLYGAGYKMMPDFDCSAVHQCHPRALVSGKVENMESVFLSKDMSQSKRNPNGWGDGERN